jgi:hypothetical protein
MLYQEIVALCSEIHTAQSNALFGHNLELFSVNPGGVVTSRFQWVEEIFVVEIPR